MTCRTPRGGWPCTALAKRNGPTPSSAIRSRARSPAIAGSASRQRSVCRRQRLVVRRAHVSLRSHRRQAGARGLRSRAEPRRRPRHAAVPVGAAAVAALGRGRSARDPRLQGAGARRRYAALRSSSASASISPTPTRAADCSTGWPHGGARARPLRRTGDLPDAARGGRARAGSRRAGQLQRWAVDIVSPGLLEMMRERMDEIVAEAGAPFLFAPPEGPDSSCPTDGTRSRCGR